MTERGFLDGRQMANAFNLLRSNDLIWPYVINNYLRGKTPFPFDLLYWNSDATRMPAANHSFYLRNCYLDNKLTKGEMTIGGMLLDLKKVHDAGLQSRDARGSHRAGEVGFPWRAIFRRAGQVRAVGFRTYRGRRQSGGEGRNISSGPAPMDKGEFDDWFTKATEHPGSWWPDWLQWLKDQNAEMSRAPEPGGAAYPPIEDAPGSYVRMKA